MRRFFFFSVFFVLIGKVYSQDLIVTIELDSIACKVTKQDENHIYFTYINDNGAQAVLIAKDRVKELLLGYSTEVLDVKSNETSNVAYSNRRESIQGFSEYTKIHLSGSVIFSQRTAPISASLSEDEQDYYRELKGGRGFQAKFHAFVSPAFAIGAQVSTLKSSHSILAEFEFEEYPDSVVIGDFSTTVSLLFIGPSIMGRYYFPNPSFLINYTFSLGYLKFTQEDFIIDTDVLFEGSSLGMNGDFGLEYLLSPNIAIGIGAGFGLGAVFNVDVTVNGQTESVDLEEAEGLGRVSFFTGLRFHF